LRQQLNIGSVHHRREVDAKIENLERRAVELGFAPMRDRNHWNKANWYWNDPFSAHQTG
jgi:hypothetical protein